MKKMDEMKGRVCVVTGSNSGMGKETALALLKMGATVVMAVRNLERGQKAKNEIVNMTGNQDLAVMICDLASTDSILHFVKEYSENYNGIDVLINNAGAVFNKRQTTVDGFEKTLAVNYLGHFLLTHELLPYLKSNAPSRIINLSSGLYKSAKIDLDDLQNEKDYNGMSAYAKAKLMIIMFTYELGRRLEGTGITVNVALPGFVATNLGKNSGSHLSSLMFSLMRPFQASARKGAETSVYLACSREVEKITGKCFSRKKEISTAPVSHDQKMQKSLWDFTAKLLGLDMGHT